MVYTPWALNSYSMAVYVKLLDELTAKMEACTCSIVKDMPFAPPRLSVTPTSVETAHGITLDAFIEESGDADTARLALLAAYRVLEQMHSAGIYHLDAHIKNFVLLREEKPGSVRVTVDGVVWHCYAIDYETTWLPPHLYANPETAAVQIKLFDEASEMLVRYGWKPHAFYGATDAAYRYDVHTLAASFLREFRTAPWLCQACDAIINHTIQSVAGITSKHKPRTYTEYLLSSSMPVVTVAEAIGLLVSAGPSETKPTSVPEE